VRAAAIALLLTAPAWAGAPAARGNAAVSTTVFGHSVRGRPLAVTRIGAANAPVRVLVVGDVHGNEPAGEAIVARLRRARPSGAALWLVRTANPDGRALDTRQNARGVDLNRNFPWRWRPGPRGTYYPGPRAASEPETQALMRLVRSVRPQLAIYYHQHLGITVRAPGADASVQREYARLTGLPLRSLPAYHGTAVSWENHVVAGASAFVVELRAGPAPAARHANAVLALTRRYVSASAASGRRRGSAAPCPSSSGPRSRGSRPRAAAR
jgi:murein peptide amidase A